MKLSFEVASSLEEPFEWAGVCWVCICESILDGLLWGQSEGGDVNDFCVTPCHTVMVRLVVQHICEPELLAESSLGSL